MPIQDVTEVSAGRMLWLSAEWNINPCPLSLSSPAITTTNPVTVHSKSVWWCLDSQHIECIYQGRKQGKSLLCSEKKQEIGSKSDLLAVRYVEQAHCGEAFWESSAARTATHWHNKVKPISVESIIQFIFQSIFQSSPMSRFCPVPLLLRYVTTC